MHVLPDGWKQEPLEASTWGASYILITSPEPDRLMATVDLKHRGFRAGIVTTGRMTSNGTYTGRGWEQALIAATIRYLDSLRST